MTNRLITRSAYFKLPTSKLLIKLQVNPNDKDARDILIGRYLYIVHSEVDLLNLIGILDEATPDDLLQEGYLAIIDAIDSAVSNGCTNLTKHVTKCIQRRILDYFQNEDNVIRELPIEEPLQPEDMYIRNETKYTTILRIVKDHVAWMRKHYTHPRTAALIETILTDRLMELGGKRVTLAAIGKSYGVTGAYVHTLENRIIRILRKRFTSVDLDPYVV